jgi:hypothetical protein
VDEIHSAADDSLSAISFIVLHAALELRGFDTNLDEVEKKYLIPCNIYFSKLDDLFLIVFDICDEWYNGIEMRSTFFHF